MGNFAENLNLGNRFRPPLVYNVNVRTPSDLYIFGLCGELCVSAVKVVLLGASAYLDVFCPLTLKWPGGGGFLGTQDLFFAHFTTFASAFFTVIFSKCLTIGYASFDAKINK